MYVNCFIVTRIKINKFFRTITKDKKKTEKIINVKGRNFKIENSQLQHSFIHCPFNNKHGLKKKTTRNESFLNRQNTDQQFKQFS